MPAPASAAARTDMEARFGQAATENIIAAPILKRPASAPWTCFRIRGHRQFTLSAGKTNVLLASSLGRGVKHSRQSPARIGQRAVSSIR